MSIIFASSTKDVYDYIAFAGNLALVAVGVWGIIVALRSVRAAEKVPPQREMVQRLHY